MNEPQRMKIRKEISTVKPLELANGWELFVQKPLDYSENSNNEMRKIMESLQWTYLNLVEIVENISWDEDQEEACPGYALAAQLSMVRLR